MIGFTKFARGARRRTPLSSLALVSCISACGAGDGGAPAGLDTRAQRLDALDDAPGQGSAADVSEPLQLLERLLAAQALGGIGLSGSLGDAAFARTAPVDRSRGEDDTITLQGRVLQLTGGGVSFLPVAVLGQGAALTDAEGNFTIPNVTTPYDIATGFSDGTQISMVLYKGLHRSDPRLVATVTSSDFSAQLSGTVSGGAGYPEPPGHRTLLNVTTDFGNTGGPGVDPTTGAFTHLATWPVAPSTTGYLTAIQFAEDAAGHASQFTGAATAELGLVDGGSIVQPVPLQPVPTTTLAGSYTYPAGYSFGSKQALVEAPTLALLFLPDDNLDNGSFSLAAPVIGERSNAVLISAFSPTGGVSQVLRRNLAPGTSRLRIELPNALDLIFPFSGSTGIDHDTLFLTTEFERGIYFYQFFSGAPGAPDFTVVTGEPVAQIPDLSSLGAALPASTIYSMAITGIGAFADVDGFAGPTGPLPSELILAASPSISFSTAP